MNKFLRAELENIIREQIKTLVEEQPNLGEAPGERLRLERLETALLRIDAENFGECFKCSRAIPLGSLRTRPERTVCDACLSESED